MKPAGEGGSLVGHAIDGIKRHIRDHDLKVGDRLPGEATFATEFGVSRAVMREAFGALGALKLIDVANGRRARVGALDGTVIGASLDHAVTTAQMSLADVWEVRRTLELRIAELAARYRTPDEATRLLDVADAMLRAGDDMPAVTREDIRFHQLISQASRNGLYLQIVRAFEPLMLVAVPRAWRTRTTPEQQRAMLDRHRTIAQAIRDGDPTAARAAMDAHFDASVGAALPG